PSTPHRVSKNSCNAFGETTNLAPAAFAVLTISAVVTVPAPTGKIAVAGVEAANHLRPVRNRRRGDFDSAHVAVDRRDGDPKRLLRIAAAEDLGDLVRERLRDCQHARRDDEH